MMTQILRSNINTSQQLFKLWLIKSSLKSLCKLEVNVWSFLLTPALILQFWMQRDSTRQTTQPTLHLKLEGWPLVVTNCHDDTDSLPPPDLTLIEPHRLHCTAHVSKGLKITWQPCSMMTCMLSYLFSFLLSNNLCLMLALPFLTFLWLNSGPVNTGGWDFLSAAEASPSNCTNSCPSWSQQTFCSLRRWMQWLHCHLLTPSHRVSPPVFAQWPPAKRSWPFMTL